MKHNDIPIGIEVTNFAEKKVISRQQIAYFKLPECYKFIEQTFSKIIIS
jgi:hypothetical protein